MARPHRPLIALVAVAVALAACGGDAGVMTERADPASANGSSEPTTAPETAPPDTAPPDIDPGDTDPDVTPAPEEPSAGTIEWEALPDTDGSIETGVLEVPVDYDDPDGPTFELFLLRHLATDQDDKIGSLLVNPGGPGFGGVDLAYGAEQIYGEELVARFDIVGFDPRGTGLTEPAIDCVDDYDRYFGEPDVTPDDEAERQALIDLAEEFQNACRDRSGDILPHITTNNSARDMDSIRRALGEEQISYFGFSYGSELGGTWVTLFPDTVRAAVLDGAADPEADALESSIQQSKGFEGTLTTYLAQCSADPDCAFHNGGDAEGAFAELAASLDESPIPSEPDRPDVNLGVFRQAFVQAMYSDSLWGQLSEALAAAQAGDGAGLLALYDDYFQRQPDGSWGNELEAFQSIRCMDQVERPTIEQSDADATTIREAAPRVAPNTTGDYFCTFFPESIDPRVEITGAGAGPVLVVGTTGDAATPLDSTRAMAAALEEGVLLVVDADQHTGYSVNDCSREVVHRFLIDLEVPADGTEC